MTFADWVHPSTRDVVIDYVRSHDLDRDRFVSTMGIRGVGLALSSAGGAAGDRAHPLVGDAAGQRLLAERIKFLNQQATTEQSIALLRILFSFYVDPTVKNRPKDFLPVTVEVLQGIAQHWTKSSTPIPIGDLHTFFLLQEAITQYVAAPNLTATWQDLIKTASNGDLPSNTRL